MDNCRKLLMSRPFPGDSVDFDFFLFVFSFFRVFVIPQSISYFPEF